MTTFRGAMRADHHTNSSTEGDHVNRFKIRRMVAASAVVGVALAMAAPALAVQGGRGFAASDIKSQPATIEGAGSTFAGPLEDSGIVQYSKENGNASFTGYLAVGSGAGEKDVCGGATTAIDWAGTDVPYGQSGDESGTCAGDAPSDFVQAPIGLGGVAFVYNIKPKFPKVKVKIHGVIKKAQVQFDLNLTGKVIAEMYTGAITNWKNKAIESLNPGVTIPSQTIFPVDRADSSGTQFIFTNFLQASTGSSVGNGTWPYAPSKNTISTYASPKSPNIINSLHNGGVASSIASVKGAAGFVEYAYVLLNPKLKQGVANIYNKAHKFVAPTPGAVAADAAHFSGISATNFSIVFGAGATSYPIAGYTWAVVWQNFTAANADISSVPSGVTAGSVNQYADEVGALTVKYLDWLAHTGTTKLPGGQDIAAEDGYVAMPSKVQAYATSQLAQVTGSAADGTPELLTYNP
jgi:phosphate transport system substrate-binding protein